MFWLLYSFSERGAEDIPRAEAGSVPRVMQELLGNLRLLSLLDLLGAVRAGWL